MNGPGYQPVMISTGPRSAADSAAVTGGCAGTTAKQSCDPADSTVSRRSSNRSAGIRQPADEIVRGMRYSNDGESVGYRSTRDEYRGQMRRLAGTPTPS